MQQPGGEFGHGLFLRQLDHGLELMTGFTVELAGDSYPTRYRVSPAFLLQQRDIAAYGHVRTVEHVHQLMNAQHLMLAQLSQQ